MLRPLPFIWSGGAMHPAAQFRQLAQRQFKEGERYVLEPHDEVSHKDRAQYFATIRDAHSNVRAEALERYPSPEHLRKWALIEAGWYEQKVQVCPDRAFAVQVAMLIRNADEYLKVVIDKVDDTSGQYMIVIRKARSQKVQPGAMTREEWRQSRQDVLDILSGVIGVSRKALEREGRTNAP